MKIIESFSNWKNDSLINENIAAAKVYMQKMAADILRKPVSELTPGEITKALSNKDYLAILNLVKEMPGYAMAFVKFHFDQGINLDQLADLANTIKTKKSIIQQLPISIDKYSSLPTGDDRVTGFEKLTDEIQVIEKFKEVKWFVDGLPKSLRDQYRSLPKDKQLTVLNMAHQLQSLGKPAIDRLFSSIKAFDHWPIDKLIDHISKYIAGLSNNGMKTKINTIEELEPEAGILYMDDRYLAISLRTENAQKKLCSVAVTWCINRESFHSYVSNGIQVNIFDFGKPMSDNLFLTGTTIYYSGTVSTAADINNKNIVKSSDPATHFRELGYPDKMINRIISEMPTEMIVKKIVYDIGLDKKKPIDILKGIIMQSYGTSEDANPKSIKIILDIINSRVKINLTKDDVIALYLQYGVLSSMSAKLLKTVADDLTKEEFNSIIKATLAKFATIHRSIKIEPSFANLPRVANVLSQEKTVLSELGLTSDNLEEVTESIDQFYFNKLVEFVMNSPEIAPTIAPTKPKTRPVTPSRPGPVPTKRPFKTPEPAKAEAEDVIKRLEILQNEEL